MTVMRYGFLPLVSVCVNSSRQCGGFNHVCVCVCETDAVCVLFHISVWPSLTNECVLNRVTTCGGNVSGHGKTFTTL